MYFFFFSLYQRRAGLKDGGRGSHVDIPRAWSELSMLAQCRGKVQEGKVESSALLLYWMYLFYLLITCSTANKQMNRSLKHKDSFGKEK